MKNEHGFTLIEAIISLAILSVIIIGFTSAFSQGYFLIGKGRVLTKETFVHQEQMEKNMVKTKNKFIEDTADTADTEVTVFQDSYYETDIPLMSITENIRGNRAFQAYVSNVEIVKPKPPQVDLEVGVYADNLVEKVFPWFGDNINLHATYTIAADPPVFSNTARWYRSKDGNPNPYFPSGFKVISEETEEKPKVKDTSTLNSEDLNKNYFYQFEISPYTFAGRLGQFTHEERIPVIKRAGSSYWQDFIEDIYFSRAKTAGSEVYTDVLLHANHPTLNVDWERNSDPGGSLIDMVIPPKYQSIPFESTVRFEVDNTALQKNLSVHGLGFSLTDIYNTGYMATINISENELSISNLNDGSTIGPFYLLTDPRFSNLVANDGGTSYVDWSAIDELTYKIYNRYDKDANPIGRLLSVELKGSSGSSDPIEIDYNLGDAPEYIGFKAYSSENYYPNQTEEIIGKYDRNFAAHFYDVTFEEPDDDDIPNIPDEWEWVDGGENEFYEGNSGVITGNKKTGLNIKMSREKTKFAGKGKEEKIVANAFWFTEDIEELQLQNHPLNIQVNDMVIFDIPIVSNNKNAKGINISGISDNSYPIYVLFSGNGRNTDEYSISGDPGDPGDPGDYVWIQADDMDVLQINDGSININRIMNK